MFRKNKFIKDFIFGEKISNEIFSIKEMYGQKGDYYRLLLSDNSGTILTQIPIAIANQTEMKDMTIGTVIQTSGVIINEGIERLLSLNSGMNICTEYIPREVFGSISNEVIQKCMEDIKLLITKMDHPGYHILAESCLTDEVLKRMSNLPATSSSYGRYNGACLVATNAVSHMVLTSMASYAKRGNHISTTHPAWNALTCASLLFLYGNLEYFAPNPPYKRTTIGIKMGYVALLQKMLDNVIQNNNIVLSDMDYANLISILKIALEPKTSLKATSKDGVILRHIIALYSDCDCFDWDIANHYAEEDEMHYYSQTVRGYIVHGTEI